MKKNKFNITFTTIENHFLTNDKEDKLFLNPNELYVYSRLLIAKPLSGAVETTCKVLSGFSHIELAKGARNADKFKEVLLSLREKGIINILDSNLEEPEDFKPSDPIMIVINEIESETKGFVKLHFEDFKRCTSPELLKVFISCSTFSQGFKCAYSRWQKILDCSKPHAIKIVAEAERLDLITKTIGRYKNTSEQEDNTYKALSVAPEKASKTHVDVNEDIGQVNLKGYDRDKLEVVLNRMINNKFATEDDYILLFDLQKAEADKSITSYERKVKKAIEKQVNFAKRSEKSRFITGEIEAKAKLKVNEMARINGEIDEATYINNNTRLTEKLEEIDEHLAAGTVVVNQKYEHDPEDLFGED